MTLRLQIEQWGDPNPRKIQQAVEVLHRGGVAAYPTDSIYALGCAIGWLVMRMPTVRRL